MKYYGKEKCKILKQIRAEIARENDIEWVVSECKHQGNCRGTCPKCEAEVRQLEEALARRTALGKKVAVVGISAGVALSVTGCANPPDPPLGGEPMPPPESETMISEGEVLTGEPVEYETEMGALPLPGEVLEGEPVEYETEMGELPLPGEVPESEAESDTESDTEEIDTEVLMGDPVVWDEDQP